MPVRHHPDCPTRIGPATGGRTGRNTRCALALLALSGAVALAALGCSTGFKPDAVITDQAINILPGASSRGVHGFSPSPVSVLVNTKITWTNEDTVAHRIAGVSGAFESQQPLAPGERYSVVLGRQGNYQYRCMTPGHRESGVIYVLP